MIPQELENIFEKYTEDNINLSIENINYANEDITLRVSIVGNYEENGAVLNQQFDIKISGCKKNLVQDNRTSFINIEDENPLLWEYNDIQCSLYYTGKCKNLHKLFWELYIAHQTIFAGFKTFDIHSMRNFNKFSNGQLASGPEKLMIKYAECLENNNLEYNMIGKYSRLFRDGKANIHEKKMKILFIGNSYFIGENFEFIKIEKIKDELNEDKL